MTFSLRPFISLIHSLLSIQFPCAFVQPPAAVGQTFIGLLGIGCKKVGNDDWGHSSNNSFGPATTKKVWPSEVKRQQKGPNLLPNSEQN